MPEAIRPAHVSTACQLKQVRIEVSRAEPCDQLLLVDSFENQIDSNSRKLPLQQQPYSFELRIDVVEEAPQLKTARPSSCRNGPHWQSRGVQPLARAHRIGRMASCRIVVGPVERPYRVVCDLFSIAHTLRHDFVEIDGSGNRSPHFWARKNRVAKIEDEWNVERLDRFHDPESCGAFEKLRGVLDLERHIDFVLEQP